MTAESTRIVGKSYVNYSSYNYLGMSGDLAVIEAAKATIDRYGTSVSASRLVWGERSIHRDLEIEIAKLYDVDDAITFVSGHATNMYRPSGIYSGRGILSCMTN